MKKFSFALIVFILVIPSLLFAEHAYWFTSIEENQTLPLGSIFNDNDLIGASNTYPLNSVVDIKDTNSNNHVIITIVDYLPETFGDRDLALSAASMEELGLFDKGHGNVTVSLIREGTTVREDNVENSGWFVYNCGVYQDAAKCYELYSRMLKNNLKPEVTLTDEGLLLTLPHIRAYQSDSVESRLALSGIENISKVGESSPYLR